MGPSDLRLTFVMKEDANFAKSRKFGLAGKLARLVLLEEHSHIWVRLPPPKTWITATRHLTQLQPNARVFPVPTALKKGRRGEKSEYLFLGPPSLLRVHKEARDRAGPGRSAGGGRPFCMPYIKQMAFSQRRGERGSRGHANVSWKMKMREKEVEIWNRVTSEDLPRYRRFYFAAGRRTCSSSFKKCHNESTPRVLRKSARGAPARAVRARTTDKVLLWAETDKGRVITLFRPPVHSRPPHRTEWIRGGYSERSM